MRFNRFVPALLVAGAALFAEGPASAAGVFTRGPFLQSLGTTGVTVKVELARPEPIRVEITGPDGAPKKLEITDAKRFQSARVGDLTPGTTYRYKVFVGAANEASDEGQFTTAPLENKPFKFILYGDSRSDPAAHAAVIRAIRGTPSDFLVHTGDMVAEGGDSDDWTSFFDAETPLLRDRCLFGSIGNHELIGSNGAQNFLRYFCPADEGGSDRPKLYGSFRWSNTRFFLLNAMDDWSGEERAWLKAELDRALGEAGLVHRFAVLHQGPFSSGPHGGNERLHDNGVMQIFRDGKVDLILAGHDHAYERGEGEGIKYVISGGAGAPLYPRKSKGAETAMFESVHHFVQFAVDGDAVSLIATRASGSILEKCGFKGAASWSCETPVDPPKAAPTRPEMQTSSACVCSLPGAGSREPAPASTFAGLAALGVLAVSRRSRRRA